MGGGGQRLDSGGTMVALSAMQRCDRALTGAAQPWGYGVQKMMGVGKNGEGTTTNLPRWSTLSRKRWFRLVLMGCLLKRKQVAVALLGDLSAVAKEGTGVGQHSEASQLVGWE
jgi:hypothetical protein